MFYPDFPWNHFLWRDEIIHFMAGTTHCHRYLDWCKKLTVRKFLVIIRTDTQHVKDGWGTFPTHGGVIVLTRNSTDEVGGGARAGVAESLCCMFSLIRLLVPAYWLAIIQAIIHIFLPSWRLPYNWASSHPEADLWCGSIVAKIRDISF